MRARNLKPGFFKNDELAECEPLARLLFAGLWCLADREGRLEDRPKRIQNEVLGYDDCDVDALLAQLADHGFILRYAVDGISFIQVTNFGKHQNPHVREPASSIPAPDEHCAGTVPAPDEHGTGPADSPFPLPDSGFSDSGSLTAEDAATPAPASAAGHIAEILVQAPWVGDELPAVIRAVERSLTLASAFNGARDGPLLAEQFVRWKGYRRKPPDDWYRAWLNWLKREPKEHDEGTNGHRNGARPADRRGAFDPASQIGGDEEAAIRAYLDGTPGAIVAGIKHD